MGQEDSSGACMVGLHPLLVTLGGIKCLNLASLIAFSLHEVPRKLLLLLCSL